MRVVENKTTLTKHKFDTQEIAEEFAQDMRGAYGDNTQVIDPEGIIVCEYER
jgi:hypothetical protein